MRTKKKILLALISVLAFSLLMVGCGTKATPTESAQIYWDALVKNDTANVEKVNLADEDVQKFIDNSFTKTKNELKLMLSKSGLSITNEQCDKLVQDVYDLGKKATVKVEEVSNDGKTAEIKYTVNYIDLNSTIQEAQTETVSEIKSLGLANTPSAQTKIMEIYLNKISDKLQLSEPSSQTVEETVKFVKNKNVWNPEDVENFASKVINMPSNS